MEKYEDAVVMEWIVPVYHKVGISLDVAKDKYEGHYDEILGFDDFIDFAMGNMRYEDWKDSTMFEIVDDEYAQTVDVEPVKERWLNCPKRVADVDNNTLWVTGDFQSKDWR